MAPMERDATLVFRLPSEIREALERAAEAEQRTMSNMAVWILSHWLMRRGYLDSKRTEVRRRP